MVFYIPHITGYAPIPSNNHLQDHYDFRGQGFSEGNPENPEVNHHLKTVSWRGWRLEYLKDGKYVHLCWGLKSHYYILLLFVTI